MKTIQKERKEYQMFHVYMNAMNIISKKIFFQRTCPVEIFTRNEIIKEYANLLIELSHIVFRLPAKWDCQHLYGKTLFANNTEKRAIIEYNRAALKNH